MNMYSSKQKRFRLLLQAYEESVTSLIRLTAMNGKGSHVTDRLL